MKTIAITTLALTLTAACGMEDGEPFECTIGELEGTWRFSYDQIEGNCGSISTEIVDFSEPSEGGNDCVVYVGTVSDDQCTFVLDQECPLEDNLGSQRIILSWEQMDERHISGVVTLWIESLGAGCRSTYEITATQL